MAGQAKEKVHAYGRRPYNPAYKHEHGKDIRLPNESKKPTARKAVTRGRSMSRKR